MRHQSFHDNLTGLPNRLLFEDRVNQALRRDRHPVGVLFVDLDLFKRVNDSLGHKAADELLQQVAERLQSTMRSSDSAARLGGDEFAVLLPDVSSEQAALDAARLVNEAMRKPFVVEQQELIVTASVGVALSPEDGHDYESLLRSADLAMYDAKAAGRDTARRPLTNVRRGGGMELETELRHALEHDELWVAYQPQIDLASRRIVGTEALVRWAHPTRGEMRPDEFLPLAEELGLLGVIDERVLLAACRQTAAWRATEVPELRASVNVSGGPLRSGALHEIVLTALRSTGLPADIVKIDRSFVREIVDRHSVVPVVTSTISMAHGLDLEIVAEGIETPAQLTFLTERAVRRARATCSVDLCPPTSCDPVG